MRILPSIATVLAATAICNAQESYRFIIDAPGPAYRQMRGDIEMSPIVEVTATLKPVMSFQPTDINTAVLVPIEGGDKSQIQLTFRPDAVKQIREFIEFNKAKPIRVEIGDYTLPIDMEKSLPWTSGVWLQSRHTEKAKTILETLQKPKSPSSNDLSPAVP